MMTSQAVPVGLETVTCDLCRSDKTEFVLRQRDLLHGVSSQEFDLVRCAGCGLLYLNPRPTMTEIGRYYPEQYFTQPVPKPRSDLERTAKRWSGRVKRWIMEDFYGYPSASSLPWPARFLRKLLLWPERIRRVWRGKDILPWIGEGRLLDVGCGPGVNLLMFQEQGWDVQAIEMSQAAAAQAKAKVGDRIHVGILATAPFPPESFDVVWLSHTLEHLFSPTEELGRVCRLLKPAGRLVITVPNAGSFESRLFGRWWFPLELPRHLYHFEKSTLTTLLERSGFRVVSVKTGVGSLYFMVSLDRAWQQRFQCPVPLRRVVEKLIAKPVCLLTGHLGYGTELTVHAMKTQAEGRSA